jgi:hypothetical protein
VRSARRSLFSSSQASSEVIHLEELRDGMQVFVFEEKHFSSREGNEFTEAGMTGNSCRQESLEVS